MTGSAWYHFHRILLHQARVLSPEHFGRRRRRGPASLQRVQVRRVRFLSGFARCFGGKRQRLRISARRIVVSLSVSLLQLRASINWAVFVYVFCANAFFLVRLPLSSSSYVIR